MVAAMATHVPTIAEQTAICRTRGVGSYGARFRVADMVKIRMSTRQSFAAPQKKDSGLLQILKLNKPHCTLTKTYSFAVPEEKAR